LSSHHCRGDCHAQQAGGFRSHCTAGVSGCSVEPQTEVAARVYWVALLHVQLLTPAGLGCLWSAAVCAYAATCNPSAAAAAGDVCRLVMGTRSGDMDPAVPLHMMNTLGMSAKEMDTGGSLASHLVFELCWFWH
jgi:hypothetical protein